MLRPRSLNQRFFYFLLLPVALLLFTMNFVALIYARNTMFDQWREASILKLQRAAHQVDMRLSRVKDRLGVVDHTVGSSFSSEIRECVLNQLREIEGVERVELIEAVQERGRHMPGGVSHGQVRKPGEGRPSQDMGHGHRLTKRIAEVTPPRYDCLVDHETVSVVKELKDDSGNSIGRIEVVMSFPYLIQDVVASTWWGSLRAFIVDEEGRVLICTTHGGRERLGDNEDPLELKTLGALREEPSGTILGEGHPPSEVSGFFRLQEAPWTLVVFAPGKEILAPIIRFRNTFTLVGTALILLVMVLIRFVTAGTVSSIQDVSRAAERIAAGDFEAVLRVRTRDEVGRLVGNFNTMARQLEDRIRLKEALDVAMEIQQSLLPTEAPFIEGLDIAGRSVYCDETGGDYYDFIHFPEHRPGRISVVIGDVIGHGIGAALLMTTVRALLRARMTQPGSLSRAVSDVNTLLCSDTDKTDSFMTLFVLELDTMRRDGCWVRAGHDPAVVYDPLTDRFNELRGQGMALGISSSYAFSEYRYSSWAEGQIIIMGTDGIWEAEDPQGRPFGKERLFDIVRRHRFESSARIVQAVIEDLDSFRGANPQQDDVTLVVVKAVG